MWGRSAIRDSSRWSRRRPGFFHDRVRDATARPGRSPRRRGRATPTTCRFHEPPAPGPPHRGHRPAGAGHPAARSGRARPAPGRRNDKTDTDRRRQCRSRADPLDAAGGSVSAPRTGYANPLPAHRGPDQGSTGLMERVMPEAALGGGPDEEFAPVLSDEDDGLASDEARAEGRPGLRHGRAGHPVSRSRVLTASPGFDGCTCFRAKPISASTTGPSPPGTTNGPTSTSAPSPLPSQSYAILSSPHNP